MCIGRPTSAHAAGSRYLGAHIPGAKVVELPGNDYFPYLGDQDAILDEIEEFLTGVRPVHVPDRALATVLFTDIVSSTQRAAALGDDAWTRMLDHHDALVAREIERHRGRKINPTGDGMLATFDGPARGVRCAQAICERSVAGHRRAGAAPVRSSFAATDIGGIAGHVCSARGPATAPAGVHGSNRSGGRFGELSSTARGFHQLGVPDGREFAVRESAYRRRSR